MPPGNPSGAFSGSAAGLVPLATERSRCRTGSTSVSGGQKWYFKSPFKSMVWWVLRILMLQIRRPAGVSCGSCLFVVVLSVLSLSLSLSRLSPWRGFLPRLTWPPVGPNLPSYPLPHLVQHRLGFAHLAVISMVVSVLLLCLPSVCSVASYIQYLIHWLLHRTPFTRIIFLNMAFSKAFLNMAFSKTLVYTHALV